jgi:hypothetical protein
MLSASRNRRSLLLHRGLPLLCLGRLRRGCKEVAAVEKGRRAPTHPRRLDAAAWVSPRRLAAVAWVSRGILRHRDARKSKWCWSVVVRVVASSRTQPAASTISRGKATNRIRHLRRCRGRACSRTERRRCVTGARGQRGEASRPIAALAPGCARPHGSRGHQGTSH